MRKDLWILAATALIVANMYYDNKIVKRIMAWKKYYRMGGVALFGVLLFLFCRRNPSGSRALLQNANDLVRLMPIDRGTSNLLRPVLRYTKGGGYGDGRGRADFRLGGEQAMPSVWMSSQAPMDVGMDGENGAVEMAATAMAATAAAASVPPFRKKRSVSETKKKFVASRQNWHCAHCRSMLTAWFEVDHVRSLETGGTNNVDNLVALCRNCHGKKTAMENM